MNYQSILADLARLVSLNEPLEDYGFVPLAGGRNNRLFRYADQPVCIKIYREDGRGRGEREWAVLNSFAQADLPNVPRPLAVQWGQPTIVAMSLLTGQPFSTLPDPVQYIPYLIPTLNQLHAHQPTGLAKRPRYDPPTSMIERLFNAAQQLDLTDSNAQKIYCWVEAWRTSTAPQLLTTLWQTIFTHGDGNILNFLWNGTELNAIDFEYAGLSDLAFECADLVEHLQSRIICDTIWDNVVLELGITNEITRKKYNAARRLFQLYWLIVLWNRRQQRQTEYQAQLARTEHFGALLNQSKV